jgi:hypothetical protein
MEMIGRPFGRPTAVVDILLANLLDDPPEISALIRFETKAG